MTTGSTRRQGFTLIELLIVVTILGIIAALLFPVFARVREKARAATCVSHLRQLGVAFQTYISDYDGQYPGAAPFNPDAFGFGWTRFGQWVFVPDYPPNNLPVDVTQGALFAYVRNTAIYICPSAYYNRGKGLSYAMNQYLPFCDESSITDPAQLILLVDEDETLNDGWFAPGCPYNEPYKDVPTTIHNTGGNYLFCDGHVKWAKPGSALVTGCQNPGPYYP